MVFGLFGKKRDDEPDDDEEEEIELVSFLGALNGKSADLAANARLAQAALIPAKELVTSGLTRRAETVRLDIKGERAQTTLVIDGVAAAGSRMSKQQAVAVSQMLKLLAGLDPKIKGKAQTGGLKGEYLETPYEILVESAPQPESGERLTVRLRNLKEKKNTIEELGIPASVKAQIRELASHRKGVIIACGPPQSGTTTLVYALLRGVDVYLYNIFSLADTGTRELINITKFEQNEGDTLSDSIMRIIRAEGEIVFVDPIRGPEMAKEVFENADKVCMIAEMPAKDAASGVAQLAQWVEDNDSVAERLDAVFSQKLIRLLCTECREAFRPNAKFLAKVGLPPEIKVLYKKGEPPVDEKTGQPGEPCSKCDGVGYLGRTGMLEIIVVNDEMRALIKSGAAPDQIKSLMRSAGMQTLHKDGLRLVAEGKTSLEELQRVFKA